MRAMAMGVALGLTAMLVAETLRVFVGSNFGCVVPGRCYRCSQPGPAFLANMQRVHGIRSVINLRDENEEDAWYRAEKAATERLGIKLVNAGLWSRQQTEPSDFRRVVKLIAEAPEPTLIHCASGSDRTGLASAIFLLLHTDTPLPEAQKQLTLRHGHFTNCLDRTLENYAAWLSDQGWEHRPEHFRYWADHVYDAK